METMTRHDIIAVIIAVSGFLIAFIIYMSKTNKNNKKNSYSTNQNFFQKLVENENNKEQELYNRLISMVFGNKNTVERLINMEKSKNPNKNRIELIKLAIERLERDRR